MTAQWCRQLTEWLFSGADRWLSDCSVVQTVGRMTAQWCRRLAEWLLSGADSWLNDSSEVQTADKMTAHWRRQLTEWLLSAAIILHTANIYKIIQESLHPLLERGVDHLPSSSAEVKERVDPYLYFSSESSWTVIGRNLPLPLLYRHPLWNPKTLQVTTKTSQRSWSWSQRIPNPPTLLLYYAFYYNTAIHAKFPE